MGMDSVSLLRAVITDYYQGVTPHSVAAAIGLCARKQEFKGVISPAHMDEINDAVEPGLGTSAALATEFCKAVFHIVWNAARDERNCITAGVSTAERVVLAITSHVEDEHAQMQGAAALGCLISRNPVNVAGILALGGIQVLITAADMHIASAVVQNWVCWALSRIALNSADGRAALCASRAVDVATRANAAHLVLGFSQAQFLLTTLSEV